MQVSVKRLWAFAVLVLVMMAPVAQERLVINVSEAKRSQSSASTIHYQPTGSVRHSEQRSFTAAQSRHSVRDAESRREVQQAKDRRTGGAASRREVQNAEGRTYSQATDRHGSVRLDTIR